MRKSGLPGWLGQRPATLEPIGLFDLPGASQERFLEAWPAFLATCERLVRDAPADGSPAPELIRAADNALKADVRSEQDARGWWSDWFTAYKVLPDTSRREARPFMTGYFEPELSASLVSEPGYGEPARGRPPDLIDVPLELRGAYFTGARQTADGSLAPYWTRAEIDAGQSPAAPIVWLRDAVDVFIAQVQGSARLRFPDGSRARLAYAGKNGRPYTSVGKVLVERGCVRASDMSLETLVVTLRRLLTEPEVGRSILHQNQSYVFFSLEPDLNHDLGPVGAAGAPLTAFRSLAIDRRHWPYGLPFWVSGRLPWPGSAAVFDRLMIAQDTGSAIVGVGRGDIFCGSGDEAGRMAGLLRHSVDLFVLAPLGR